MTAEIMIMLLLLFGVTICFSFEWLRVDVLTLFLLCLLVVFGMLSPVEAFSGFASELIIILTSIFVISGTLAASGVMQWLGQSIHRLFKDKGNDSAALIALMSIAAVASALVSNTSATAILMPAAKDCASRFKVSSSRFLMPLAFSSILGGTCTLIGTSTNLAGSSMVSSLGLAGFSLFEFTLVGLIMLVLGIVYLGFFGKFIIPSRSPVEIVKRYGIQAYLSEITVPEGSSVVGKRIEEIKLFIRVSALVVVRNGKRLQPSARTKLRANDTIVVKAAREALLELLDRKDFYLESERPMGEAEIASDNRTLAEAVVLPQSRIQGKTLKQLRFFQRFGVVVLAISRKKRTHPVRIDRMPLKVGDVLLLHGALDDLEQLKNNPNLWGLTPLNSVVSRRKGIYTLVALTGGIILGLTNLVPLSIAFLLAALCLVISKCITMDEAYHYIEWRLIVLIAGMTAFGLAMEKTGTATFLAEVLVNATSSLGIYATMAGLALITVLLTQPMSNAAAALVVIPIAVATGMNLGVDPRSLAILVTLSASLSFITPFEPASLLVYSAGNYKFIDYVRVGLPLTFVTIGLLIYLVPIIWPL